MSTMAVLSSYFLLAILTGLWVAVGLTFVVDMFRYVEVRTRGIFVIEIIGCILGPLVAIPLLIYSFGALVWIDIKADLPTMKRWWNCPLDDKDRMVYDRENPLPTVNTLYLETEEYGAIQKCNQEHINCLVSLLHNGEDVPGDACRAAHDACLAKIRGEEL